MRRRRSDDWLRRFLDGQRSTIEWVDDLTRDARAKARRNRMVEVLDLIDVELRSPSKGATGLLLLWAEYWEWESIEREWLSSAGVVREMKAIEQRERAAKRRRRRR